MICSSLYAGNPTATAVALLVTCWAQAVWEALATRLLTVTHHNHIAYLNP